MTSSPSRLSRVLLIGLILAAAILFRLWRIDTLPPGFHFDESFESLEAWRIYSDAAYRPLFLEGNFGVPPLNAYVTALGFAVGSLFDIAPGPALARTSNALAGILTVVAIFGMAVELRKHDRLQRLSSSFPYWAAATLAVMRWHVHFSRMAIEPIYVPLEWILATWMLLRGWRTGSLFAFAAAGIVTALSLYTYQGAWVLPFLLGATALLLLIVDRRGFGVDAPHDRIKRRWLGLLVAGTVAFAVALPLLLYFSNQLDLVFLRPTQVNVVGSTASPADAGILHNLWATVKMYFPFGMSGDMDPRRNLPGAPALNLWLAIPFAIGIVLAFMRLRNVAYWVTLLGLAGLLSVGVFTEYAPHFHRILGAAAPTALLCAFGLEFLWQLRPARARFVRWIAPLLIVLAAIFGWRDYFVRWANLPDLYYAFDQGLWEVGNWIADQPEDEPVYLTPRDASHPTLAFAWQTKVDAHSAPVTFDGRSIFPVDANDNPTEEAYVVISHEDFRTPLLLPEVLPDAVQTTSFSDWSGAPYAAVYQRPALTTSARPPFVTLETPVGDGIRLAGYDAQPAQLLPGDILYVQLHWLIDALPTRDWTVFVHLRDAAQPDGPPLASRDEQPGGGSLPTTRWQPGWRVLDEHQLALPTDLPSGSYELVAGMYDGAGNQLGPITLGDVEIQARAAP